MGMRPLVSKLLHNRHQEVMVSVKIRRQKILRFNVVENTPTDILLTTKEDVYHAVIQKPIIFIKSPAVMILLKPSVCADLHTAVHLSSIFSDLTHLFLH